MQLGEARARVMILQGAAKLLAERGARETSVEDILAAAALSRRTFYRLYKSKEDVLAALYRIGTDRLIDACRRAVDEEDDLVRQIERFIDGYLRNAREFGRLVFVLGGEAARQESLLHARRMEVHAILAALLAPSKIDPLVLRTLFLAFEGLTRMMLEECDQGRRVTDARVRRVRRVMMRIATATVAGQGPDVAPLPTAR